MKLNTFYVQYAVTAFEITKEQGANAEKCLAVRNFRNLVSFVLIQNMNSTFRKCGTSQFLSETVGFLLLARQHRLLINPRSLITPLNNNRRQP